MNHFLAPVLRHQFILFYRFGYTFIPDALLIPFKDSITKPIKDEVTKLLKQVTPFEYDEEYVILHLQHESDKLTGITKFDIQQLTAIYPLSRQAKASIAQKTDPRIILSEPLFEECVAIVEDTILKEEVSKGIEALWNLYLEEDDADKEKLLRLIGIDNLLEALTIRGSGIKANNLVDKSYWSYLLTYERYDYFPKERIGYFYDAGQLFAYSKGKPTFENSQLHGVLSKIYSNKSTANFEYVVKVLIEDPQAAGYINQTVLDGVRLYILAPLFLLLKDEIRNAESFSAIKDSPFFEYAKGIFKLEFKAALILLGAFFSYKTFYDEYYNFLKLDIYNQPEQPIAEEPFSPTKPKAARIENNLTEASPILANINHTIEPPALNLSTLEGIEEEPIKQEMSEATAQSIPIAKPKSASPKERAHKASAKTAPQKGSALGDNSKNEQKNSKAISNKKPQIAQLGLQLEGPEQPVDSQRQGEASTEIEPVTIHSPEKISRDTQKIETKPKATQKRSSKEAKPKLAPIDPQPKEEIADGLEDIANEGYKAGQIVNIPLSGDS